MQRNIVWEFERTKRRIWINVRSLSPPRNKFQLARAGIKRLPRVSKDYFVLLKPFVREITIPSKKCIYFNTNFILHRDFNLVQCKAVLLKQADFFANLFSFTKYNLFFFITLGICFVIKYNWALWNLSKSYHFKLLKLYA